MASEALQAGMAPRTRLIYRMLVDAAEAGRPCPSNADIAAQTSGDARSYGTYALQQLEQMGLIRIHRSHNARIVTIVATGKVTADPDTVPTPKQSRLSASRMRIDDLPAGASLAVDRSPCPRCGTRRDRGCRHTASALFTRFGRNQLAW
ncbi:MAG: hypothetical protein ACOY5R_10600 [Pseudomonadota bacterium]